MINVQIILEEELPGRRGGFVRIYSNSDLNKRIEHYKVALILANKGYRVVLMPEIHVNDIKNRQLFYPELTNSSNPDARFNGVLGEFKIPDGKPVSMKAIQNAISGASRKEVSICVISLLDKEYFMHEILSQIRGSLKDSKTNVYVKEVWLILKDGELLKIPRGITIHRHFYKLIHVL